MIRGSILYSTRSTCYTCTTCHVPVSLSVQTLVSAAGQHLVAVRISCRCGREVTELGAFGPLAFVHPGRPSEVERGEPLDVLEPEYPEEEDDDLDTQAR